MLKIIYSFVTVLLLSKNIFAQLQVYPTHVFLNQRTTSSHLSIKNTTNLVQKYKIDLKFYKMNKAGDFSEVADGQNQPLSLKKYIKFSPQEVTLEANSQQTVRLMLVDQEKLDLPEYYVHIYFVPNNISKTDPTTKNNFSLQGKVAVAIPILFRNGDIQYKPSVDNLKVKINKDGDLDVTGVLKNLNNNFFYGQFELYKVDKAKEELIGVIKGVSSYVAEKKISWKIKKSDFENNKLILALNDNLKLVLKNDPDDTVDFKNEIAVQISK